MTSPLVNLVELNIRGLTDEALKDLWRRANANTWTAKDPTEHLEWRTIRQLAARELDDRDRAADDLRYYADLGEE